MTRGNWSIAFGLFIVIIAVWMFGTKLVEGAVSKGACGTYKGQLTKDDATLGKKKSKLNNKPENKAIEEAVKKVKKTDAQAVLKKGDLDKKHPVYKKILSDLKVKQLDTTQHRVALNRMQMLAQDCK